MLCSMHMLGRYITVLLFESTKQHVMLGGGIKQCRAHTCAAQAA